MKSVGMRSSEVALGLILASQFAQLVGTSFEQVMVSWLVFDRSGSSILLGVVGFLTGFFAAVSALLAGAWSDRHEPRLVLVATQTIAAVISAVFLVVVALGRLETSAILVFAMAASLCSGPSIPMQQALLANVVGRRDIGATIATSSIVYDLARLVGPAAGGFVLAQVSVSAVLLAGMFCHALSASVLLVLPTPTRAQAIPSDLRGALAEGFSHVTSSRPILAIVGLSACVCVATSTLTVLMPVMAGKFGSTSQTLGLLLATLSAGAIGGSLFQRFNAELIRLPRRIASGAIILSVSMVLFAFVPSLPLALFALLGAGLALNLVMTSCTSVLLSITKEEIRGRVMSCFALSFMGVAPMSGLAAGFVAEMASASFTISAAALVSLLAGALFLVVVAPLKRML